MLRLIYYTNYKNMYNIQNIIQIKYTCIWFYKQTGFIVFVMSSISNITRLGTCFRIPSRKRMDIAWSLAVNFFKNELTNLGSFFFVG